MWLRTAKTTSTQSNFCFAWQQNKNASPKGRAGSRMELCCLCGKLVKRAKAQGASRSGISYGIPIAFVCKLTSSVTAQKVTPSKKAIIYPSWIPSVARFAAPSVLLVCFASFAKLRLAALAQDDTLARRDGRPRKERSDGIASLRASRPPPRPTMKQALCSN